MSKIVLDASAILAVIMGESGEEKLTPRLLADAVISTVDLLKCKASYKALGGHPMRHGKMPPVSLAKPFTSTNTKHVQPVTCLPRPVP